jgi:hypothetical protein
LVFFCEARDDGSVNHTLIFERDNGGGFALEGQQLVFANVKSNIEKKKKKLQKNKRTKRLFDLFFFFVFEGSCSVACALIATQQHCLGRAIDRYNSRCS